MAEVKDAPFDQSDDDKPTKTTKEVLGDQLTEANEEDPEADVTAPRTEKQVVTGTIKPDKQG